MSVYGDFLLSVDTTAHEVTRAFGSDHVAGQGRGDMTDRTRPGEALRYLASLRGGQPAWRRPNGVGERERIRSVW